MVKRVIAGIMLVLITALTCCANGQPPIRKLRFETDMQEELGNSVTNLRHLGLIAGDRKQLYTIEYWGQDSDEKREGMQIYVSDARGKRCLTNEADIIGYLNLSDSAVYYLSGRGICMIDRGSEIVREVVPVQNASGLLLAKNQLYYFVSDALFSYDLISGQQSRIVSTVTDGYLDYAEGRVVFCQAADGKETEFSLCYQNDNGEVEEFYTFDAQHIAPYKVLDFKTLICAVYTQEDKTGTEQCNLVKIDLQKNEQQILLPGFLPLSYSQNGEQAIAGSGTNAADAYWLIDLIEGSREKLPAWGGGALCFAGNRLFSVNVVTVRQEEVIIKNDQFYAVPLP